LDDRNISLTACEMEQCRLKAEDGDITIGQSAGSFDIEADDGDIEMNQIRAEALDIQSEDGDLEPALSAGDMMDADISTDDGSVSVGLEKAV